MVGGWAGVRARLGEDEEAEEQREARRAHEVRHDEQRLAPLRAHVPAQGEKDGRHGLSRAAAPRDVLPLGYTIKQGRARACGARRRRVLVAAHRRVAACSSLGLGLGVAGGRLGLGSRFALG